MMIPSSSWGGTNTVKALASKGTPFASWWPVYWFSQKQVYSKPVRITDRVQTK